MDVKLHLDLAKDQDLQPPIVRVNSILCPAPVRQEDTIFVYPVPESAFADEVHVIETEAAQSQPVKITRIDFAIGTPDAPIQPEDHEGA